MKKSAALILAALMLLCSCKARPDIETQEESETSAAETKEESADAAAETKSPPKYWFSKDPVTKADETPAEMTVEELYEKAKADFMECLSSGALENAKVKLYFNADGECEVTQSPSGLAEAAAEFAGGVTLRSKYVEISLDSRFSNGVGVACAEAELAEIPEAMPNSYNFADGVFEGELSGIKTCPVLKEGVSLAEYEYSSMPECIAELNAYAAAAAQTAGEVLQDEVNPFDEWYISCYGTAHTVLCCDENGWRINGDYNNEILTKECTEKIISAFNENKTLSAAADCTVQLMFYMEELVGVSANYSADEKYFSTYDVSFWESWKAPYEESYHDKSFLFWSGIDGCLKGENGRLCPVGTYCTATKSPLGVYVSPSVMGDWKITRVGEKPFAEYAAEVSNGWCDYTQLVCLISESRLFLYGGALEVSLYDIEQNGDGYDILYHTRKQGALTANSDGTLTLSIRHGFTKNNISLPLTLERYTPEIIEDYDYTPPKNERLSAEEYAARDTEKYDLLDLSGERVIGQEIPDPNVLSEYRRYVANGGAYTVEIYTVGAGRLEYELASYDGSAGYQRSEITVYDGDDPIGWETITINGGCYESYYKLDRYDMRKYEYRSSDYDPAPFVSLLCESEYGSRKFVKAYMITIGGVEYICEEWNFDDIDNPIYVYSVDGEIKGYEGNFYGKPIVNTVTRLEKQAEAQLIRIPENSTHAQSHDFD